MSNGSICDSRRTAKSRSTISSLPIHKLDMSLPAADDYKSIDVLLNEWRSQVVREAGHFVEDGAVCQESWSKAKLRVLFLLKEPNGYKGEHGPLNELLRKAATTNPGSAMWDRPTFHNIGRWAYGLANYSHGAPGYQEANKAYKTAVLECAYINIKKSSGGARATKEVAVHAAKYAAFLRRQVDLLAPDIVVCGGTYSILKEHVYPHMTKVSPRIHKDGDRIFINAFHPGCRAKREMVYEQVLSSYHEFMKLQPLSAYK